MISGMLFNYWNSSYGGATFQITVETPSEPYRKHIQFSATNGISFAWGDQGDSNYPLTQYWTLRP